MTIIETAKLNGLDPQAYLADILDRIYDCVFRSMRPPIPTTCAHLFRGIRPPVTRCREAVEIG
jgi:hypothetical protein